MGDIEITIKTNFKTKIKIRKLLKGILFFVLALFFSNNHGSNMPALFSSEKIAEKAGSEAQEKNPSEIQRENKMETFIGA